MKVTKIIETETGHRLTDYSGSCACLHGHRYRWEVTVEADELDSIGFVIDFKELKDILNATVNKVDHAFLFHNKDPIIVELINPEKFLRATHSGDGRVFILDFNPTSENILNWMAVKIEDKLPLHIHLHRIKLWETSNSYTIWNPS